MADEKEFDISENQNEEPIPENKFKIVKKSDVLPPAPQEGTPEFKADRCHLCGENRKAKGTDFCPKCIDKLKKKKPPFTAWLVFILTLAAGVFAFCFGFMNFAPSKRIAEGNIFARQDRVTDAFNSYADAYSLADELNAEVNYDVILVGNAVRRNMVEYAGDPLAAGYYASQYFTDAQIASDPMMKKNKEIYDSYKATYDLVNPTITSLDEGKITPEKALETITALKKEYPQYLLWITYYESYVDVTYAEKGYKVQLEYLKKMEKLFPDYGWFYNNMIRSTLYILGQYDECITYCDKEIAANRNFLDPYLAKLRIAMMNDNKAAAKQIIAAYNAYNDSVENSAVMNILYQRRFVSANQAIATCDAALKGGASSTELTRQQALNYLITGDYTAAFDAAYEAYSTATTNYYSYGDSSEMTNALFETVYVCTKLYKLTGAEDSSYNEDVDTVLESFSGYENEATEASIALICGDTTPEAVLTKGTGDLV